MMYLHQYPDENELHQFHYCYNIEYMRLEVYRLFGFYL